MKVTRKFFKIIFKLTKWSWNSVNLTVGMSALSIPILILSLLLTELTKNFFPFDKNYAISIWCIILYIISYFFISVSILVNNTFKLEEDLKKYKDKCSEIDKSKKIIEQERDNCKKQLNKT